LPECVHAARRFSKLARKGKTSSRHPPMVTVFWKVVMVAPGSDPQQALGRGRIVALRMTRSGLRSFSASTLWVVWTSWLRAPTPGKLAALQQRSPVGEIADQQQWRPYLAADEKGERAGSVSEGGSRTSEPSPMTSSVSVNGARAESSVGSKPI
jgi:hypothetical protein